MQLEAGPSKTDKNVGVYNEGHERKHCVLGYMIHEVLHADTGLAIAACFELIRDEACTTRVNLQQCTRPEGVSLTGLFLHVVNVASLFTKGYLGQFRVSDGSFQTIRKLSEELYKPSAPRGSS